MRYSIKIESAKATGATLKQAAIKNGIWGGMSHTTSESDFGEFSGQADGKNADEVLDLLTKIAKTADATDAILSVRRFLEK